MENNANTSDNNNSIDASVVASLVLNVLNIVATALVSILTYRRLEQISKQTHTEHKGVDIVNEVTREEQDGDRRIKITKKQTINADADAAGQTFMRMTDMSQGATAVKASGGTTNLQAGLNLENMGMDPSSMMSGRISPLPQVGGDALGKLVSESSHAIFHEGNETQRPAVPATKKPPGRLLTAPAALHIKDHPTSWPASPDDQTPTMPLLAALSEDAEPATSTIHGKRKHSHLKVPKAASKVTPKKEEVAIVIDDQHNDTETMISGDQHAYSDPEA